MNTARAWLAMLDAPPAPATAAEARARADAVIAHLAAANGRGQS